MSDKPSTADSPFIGPHYWRIDMGGSPSPEQDGLTPEHELTDGTPGIREIAHPVAPLGTHVYESFATDNAALIDAARKMTAHYYLKRHFIEPDELDSEGRIAERNDPYLAHSEYYVIKNMTTDALVATCRKVHHDPTKGADSFPLLQHREELDPQKVAQLQEIGYENIAELSALVKDPQEDADGQATMAIYRELFQNAWKADNGGREAAYIMACNPKLYKRLRILFGDIIEPLGASLQYPGQEVVPAMIRTRSGTASWIQASTKWYNPHAYIYRKGVKALFTGADLSQLDPGIAQALTENGYGSVVVGGNKESVSRRPEAVAAIGLLGYTAVRTIAVKEAVSPGTHVDWRVFLAIEALTTWPYVKGMGTMLRSIKRPTQFSRKQKIEAAAAAGTSFLAPYAYVGIEGHNMPTDVWAGVGAFVAVSLVSAVRKIRQARRQSRDEILPADPDSQSPAD